MTRQGPRDSRVATRPSMIILQPTCLCNLDCTYCYLPGRKSKNEMSLPVARAIAEGINPDWVESAPLELVWHGGEPLAIDPTLFEELLKSFIPLHNAGLVYHVIQTNATLITDEWCELFLKHDIDVGVSLDGPATLNHNRVDWRGKPALTRIMDGIAKLTEHDINFSVIAVIDQTAIDSIHQILDFLATLGPPSIALNLEEREGVNPHHGSPSLHEARTLWRDVFAWAGRNRSIRIREDDRLLSYLAAPPSTAAADVPHDPLPTVAWNGNVILLSPELLGIKPARYADFMAGNRFFEHGVLSTTETHHCHITTQALVTGFFDLTETASKDSMTLLEKLVTTKSSTLLALINPYRNPDNDVAPALK